MTAGRTLYDKICAAHAVRELDDKGHILLYVDRHFLNEYTSPQAFSALREGQRSVWRPRASLAVVDHVNSTAPLTIPCSAATAPTCPITAASVATV